MDQCPVYAELGSAILDFVEVNNLNTMLPAPDDGAFNMNPAVTDLGRLPLPGTDFLGTSNTLPDGSVLFEVCFEVTGSYWGRSAISLLAICQPHTGGKHQQYTQYTPENVAGAGKCNELRVLLLEAVQTA